MTRQNLTSEQLARLMEHSRANCESCGTYGNVHEHHTAGADPTTWQLCATCHPRPNSQNAWLDEGYADFLTEPQAPTYEAHVRLMHEGEDDPWGFHAALTPEEAIAPALASEQRRQAMLDKAAYDAGRRGDPDRPRPVVTPAAEPELERLRRLPTTDPQLCPNCDARMSGKRCYSCGLEQL